ncbi:Ig-like domain-containing protein [Mycobacterium sp. CVI_P3]|uniref:Ig-like domain-containing protein n=1 Tax=Mycobacterium pinniadriaticum TaxID=2994102 RepID=A0ABT3SCF2_9MYCO|nr:Ig-like domain-containing protein [Mycobacterium pinniadriaticum]MCX2930782.1 Ig-like domain-containing protein [Mycobacterium pinniadriaticum]MCX2937206.1 Ig-like domain-containing protein [Mycobacterium pinniadriaticum]
MSEPIFDGTATTARPTLSEAPPGAPAYPPSITTEVSWHSIVSEALTWAGLGELAPNSPIPDAPPVPDVIAAAWIGVRRFHYTYFNSDPTLRPTGSTQNPDTSVITGDLAGSDVDGDTLTYTVVQKPTQGSVTVAADGSYTYTPTAALADTGGTDSFTVSVDDTAANPWHTNAAEDVAAGFAKFLAWMGLGSAPVATPATVTVTVEVTAINHAPLTTGETYTTAEDTALSLTAAQLLANDVDPDGDTISLHSYTQPGHGTLSDNADGTGTLVYTPDADYTGTDSFTYTIADSAGAEAQAVVTITVTPVNDPPVATNATYTIDEDTSLQGDLLANATDVEGDTLHAAIIVEPTHGSVSLDASGTFTYTPEANYAGTDSFTYAVTDTSNTTSAPATISIVITPVNHAPTLIPTVGNADPDTGTRLIITTIGDPDGDAVIVTATSTPVHGTLTDNSGGVFTYTPDAGFAHTGGTDTITFTATDSYGATTHTTITVTVDPINHAPTLTLATTDAHPITGAVIITAITSDPDGDHITVDVAQPSHGTVVALTAAETEALKASLTAAQIAALGLADPAATAYRFTPDTILIHNGGAETITFTATDASGASTTRTVTVDVVANQPPRISDVTYRDHGNGTLTIIVTASDPEAGTTTLSATANGIQLAATAPADGSTNTRVFTYTGGPGQAVALTVTATDASGLVSTFTDTVALTAAASPTTVTQHAPTITALTYRDHGNGTVDILITATDPDGTAITNISATANGMVLTRTTPAEGPTPGTAMFTYTATPAQIAAGAVLDLHITVTDPTGLTTTLTPAAYTLATTTNPAPVTQHAPTITALTYRDHGNGTLDILITATDPDGTTITNISATANGTPLAVTTPAETSTDTWMFTYTGTPGETVVLTLAATDPTGLTTTLTPAPYALTSMPTTVNHAPRITSIAVSASNPTTGNVTVTVAATDDDSGDAPATVKLRDANGAVLATASIGDDGMAILTYSPDDVLRASGGQVTLTVTAVDTRGAETTQGVTLTIDPVAPNHAPVLANGDYSVDTETGMVAGTVAASDPDGDTLNFTVTSADNSLGELAYDTATGAWAFLPTAQARFAAATGAGPRTVEINITASDGIDTATTTVAADIDPAVGIDTSVIANLSGVATDVAVEQDGTINIAAYEDRAIIVLNADGTITDTITTEIRPFGIAVGPDGRIYVSRLFGDNGNGEDEQQQDPDVLYVIDPTDHSTDTIHLNATPLGALAFDHNGRLYVPVTSGDTGALLYIDPDGSTNTIDVEGIAQPIAVAVDGDDRVYVTGLNSDGSGTTLTILNADQTVASTVDLGVYPSQLQALAVADDGRTYFTNIVGEGSVTLTVFDSDGRTIGTADLFAVGLTAGPDGQIYYAGFNAIGGTAGTITLGAPQGQTANSYSGVVDGSIAVPNPGYTLTYALDSTVDESVGTVELDAATGHWTFTPTEEARHNAALGTGPTTIEFTATASSTDAGYTKTVTLTATIEPANSAPQIYADTDAQTAPDTGIVTGRVTVIDYDNDPVTLTTTTINPTIGTIELTADASNPGTYTYTFTPTGEARQHAADGSGPTTVTITLIASDNNAIDLYSNTFGIAVINAAPTLTVEVTAADTITGSVVLIPHTTDPDGDAVEVAITTAPSNGTLTDNGDGTYTYTPSEAARLYAYSTVGDDFDAIVVSAIDSSGNATDATVENIPIEPSTAGIVSSIDLTGSQSSAVVLGPDGTAYKIGYTGSYPNYTNTYVTVIDPADPTNQATVELPGGPSGSVSFGADGTAFQTTSAGTTTYLTVIDPADLANPTTLEISGIPVGGAVVGSDGTAYQTTREGTSGNYTTHVAVIDPSDPSNPTVFDISGDPRGGVVFGLDGAGYLLTETGSYGNSSTRVTVIDVGAPTNPSTVVDLPGSLAGSLQMGTDGTIYLTTNQGSVYSSTITYVTLINPDDLAHPTTVRLPGFGAPTDGVVVSPDGTAYQSVFNHDGTNFYTTVTVIDPADPSNPTTTPKLLGRSNTPTTSVTKGVLVGPDGTAYQTTYSGSTTYITVIQPTDPAHPTTFEIAGQPIGYDSRVFMGSDGTAYQALSADGSNTTLVVIDPAELTYRTIDLAGRPVGNLGFAAGSNGITYLVTRSGSSPDYAIHVLVFDPANPTNPTILDIPGYGFDRLVLAADGTAYQTAYTGTYPDYTTSVTVINPADPANPTTLDLPGQPSGAVVFGTDGAIYQTHYVRSTEGTTTYVTVLNPADPSVASTAQMKGDPSGLVAGDGGAYLTTQQGTYPNYSYSLGVIAVQPPAVPQVL